MEKAYIFILLGMLIAVEFFVEFFYEVEEILPMTSILSVLTITGVGFCQKLFLLFLPFLFFYLFRTTPQHMEVPRLGVKLQL